MLCEYKCITTGTVIFDKKLEKVILVDRQMDSAFPNAKGLPGGKLNIGETFEDAAKREVQEEVKIEVKNLLFSNIYHAENIIMICHTTTINKEDCYSIQQNSIQQMWYNFKDLNNLKNNRKLAPNVYKACNNAYKQLTAFYDSQNLTSLDYSFKAAAQFVRNHHNKIDGQIGWGHHAEDVDIGTIGTAIGILSLTYAGIPANDPLIKSSVETLMDMVTPDGGWSIRSIERAEGRIAITESTCFSLWVLKETGLSDSELIVKNGLNWLIENQHSSGGWGLNKSSEQPRVLPTSFALFILSQFGIDRKIIQKTIDWLKSAQLPDGGWGIHSNYIKSTVAHTSRAIIALTCVDVPQNNSLVMDGVKWLQNEYQHQSKWEDINEIDYLHNLHKGTNRFEFKHAATPLALIALLESGHAFYEPELLATAANIIRNQKKNGSWEHSLTPPDFIPIWNMLENIRAIKCLSNNIVKYPSLIIESKFHNTFIHNTLPPLLVNFVPKKISNYVEEQGNGGKTPWWIGPFYLISCTVIMTVIAIISKNVPTYVLPLVIIGGLLAIVVIGSLQLGHYNILDPNTLPQLMSKFFERLLNLFKGFSSEESQKEKDKLD